MTDRLFAPLDLGPMTIRNRIVSTGHDTTLPTDDKVNEALVAYHQARAAGGVGLIVAQVTGVHESARYTSHVLMGWRTAASPGSSGWRGRYRPGELLQSYVRDTMLKRALSLGVEVIPYARLFGTDGTTGYFQNIATGEAMILEEMDTLILAQAHRAQDALLTQCEAAGLPVTGIGDCLAPRTAEEAVLEGLKAGWAV